MSMRNVRKMFGDKSTLPPLEGNSDEEFEPLYAKETKSKFTYAGLELSTDEEEEVEEKELPVSQEEVEEKPKKKKKTKKRQRRPKPKNEHTENDKELDEIDKSVLEVNALLGAPAPAPAVEEKKKDPRKMLFSVQSKHLDFNNELKRIFGSESLDDGNGKKYRPHNVVKYRRAVIVPIPEHRHFTSVGLSMSLQRRENGFSYFTFDHNREYQKMHQLFLDTHMHEEGPFDEAHWNLHIEGLLERADFMFHAEEYTAANKMLESIIQYMHYVAHPLFNLTDQSVRLEYNYIENRPFFIAVTKYMHMLTNKACHRTALELAKMMLNMDPTDPLAIIYVIDVIALRAREHQWLIDVIEYWSKERDAGYLFNMQYSNALAHFHVTKKAKSTDYSLADKLLQEAMLLYPTVASRIFENCKHDPSQSIRSHPYFNVAAEDKFPDKIKTAMIFHTKMVCWRWREPPVMEWFFRNAQELVKKLDTDPETKERGALMKPKRQQLLAGCPRQLHRHLQVVRHMSQLLVEWEIPNLTRQRACDPIPPTEEINRYGYGIVELRPTTAIWNRIFPLV